MSTKKPIVAQPSKIKKAKKPSATQKGVKGFLPGRSGNPKGRHPGSRNKTTMMVEAMLDGEAEEITRLIIERAKKGEEWALKWVGDRFVPRRRSQPIRFNLPSTKTTEDLVAAFDSLMREMAAGEVAPDEAEIVVNLFTKKLKLLETLELDRRVFELETWVAKNAEADNRET